MTEQTDAKVRMHAADLEAAGNLAEARQVAADALHHLVATVASRRARLRGRKRHPDRTRGPGAAARRRRIGSYVSRDREGTGDAVAGRQAGLVSKGLASLTRARALAAAGRTTEARAEAAAAEAMFAAVDANHPAFEQARAIAGR